VMGEKYVAYILILYKMPPHLAQVKVIWVVCLMEEGFMSVI
jgi:hypothetical protein